jgi:hypothetical protein
MKVALEKGKGQPPHKIAYSSKTLVRLQKFLPLFEHTMQIKRMSVTSQNKKSKDYNDVVRKARIYLTHFIRVMNMAIYRGDLPVETRAFYGLPINDSNVPSLNTENELINWGKRIIEGEEQRIKRGGSPITNPTIAVVKVRFEQFLDALNFNKTQSRKKLDNVVKNNQLRKEADEIILSVWNEVESNHSDLDENEKRKECQNYGLVYFYRKGELNITEPAEVKDNSDNSGILSYLTE